MYCISYVIKKGDSLYKISRQFKVRVEDIIKANPLVNVYRLTVDDAICVPVNTVPKNYSGYRVYKVGDNESLNSVLEGSHIDLGDLLSFNDLSDIYLQPGTDVKVPVTESEESRTTPSDTTSE